MIGRQKKPDVSVVFVEVNEAEKYFLEKYVAQGKLPAFQRMLAGGRMVRTKIPGWDAGEDKAWRAISPWIVWPSVYTGMTPAAHGIIGFGQDTSSIRGRCVWDVLDAAQIPVGVFGSLMSYPPRSTGAASYYIPESLADDAECFPEAARPLQEFCVFSARNYSENFSLKAATAVKLLLRTRPSGVKFKTMLRTLGQMPAEVLHGPSSVPERAMLHSYLTVDAWKSLYSQFKPAYTSVHLNHVAYMQHRYWRAAEPERFQAHLSATDQRFFGTVGQREAYERKFSHWIEKSFTYTDQVLGEILDMVDPNTVVLVGTALGQRPFDPVVDIHNPVVRLVKERELFDALGLCDYVVLHQMNPDLTVNFPDEERAAAGARAIEGLYVHAGESLFTVQRRGPQVFIELNMPKRATPAETFTIRHATRPGLAVEFGHHIHEHPTADQSTAHHKDSGWLLAYCAGQNIVGDADVIRVTDIAPTILALFGLPPQAWMERDAKPAFRLAS